LLLLTGDEIHELLRDREKEILETVKSAYMACDRGNAVMPANSYLRFPGKEKERIIAKIAYLGEGFEAAGIKWISSFPENIARNIERASAALILNSVETGRPTAVLEGSIISAKRTAASAALAASCFLPQQEVESVGLIGCGLINFETLRFLVSCFPGVSQVVLYDLSQDRARQFQAKVLRSWPALRTRIGESFGETEDQSQVLSLATTAVTPHVRSLPRMDARRVILHLSVRDLAPEIILDADNVVDDVDQACSHETSLHLTERKVGHRDFIRCTLGEILNGGAPAHADPELGENGKTTILTPFGLGALDVAVGELARSLAVREGAGREIRGFFPKAWNER
jgi:ornithine cyclodeaminase